VTRQLAYLTTLQKNREQVVREAERWLPWNDEETLLSLQSGVTDAA